MRGKLPWPHFLENSACRVIKEVDGLYEPTKIELHNGKAIYDPKGKSIMTAEKQLIQITGKFVIKGDINPTDPTFKGFVEYQGKKRQIQETLKVLNPDGSVYSTEVMLK
jgi:hypothetical protein